TVRPDGRVGLGAHDLRLGAAYAGQHITLLVNGPRVVFHALDGQPLGHLTLDPHQRYARMEAA
uniref:hypothetical protein n=1 Tax=Trujillonella humicola TaxID=3383699 RepID=UPI003CC834CD